MTNSYLPDDRWSELQKTLAMALTPLVLGNDREALQANFDQAANLLADLGIMPEEMREDEIVVKLAPVSVNLMNLVSPEGLEALCDAATPLGRTR